MKSENLKREINPGHYLELMDRLYVLASTLHDHCLEHPLAEYDEEIYTAIETAIESTYDAYQLVGSKEFENENENNPHQ
jgi:hypothetical protein